MVLHFSFNFIFIFVLILIFIFSVCVVDVCRLRSRLRTRFAVPRRTSRGRRVYGLCRKMLLRDAKDFLIFVA